jgi:hypothetical protein
MTVAGVCVCRRALFCAKCEYPKGPTLKTSSPLAKEDPVLGNSGLDSHILVFSTPENAPTEISLGLKKSWGKKGHKNHPQKKVRALPYYFKFKLLKLSLTCRPPSVLLRCKFVTVSLLKLKRLRNGRFVTFLF